MDFSRRKLPQEAALNLRLCPIASVKPYALMLAPVYVLMRANGKFVSIKGPLDFFTPEELERYEPFESFYLPEFVDSALPFRQVARHVRALVTWIPISGRERKLPPAPYEVSDAVLRMIAPLWGAGAVIEPFFAAIFANELCDPLPEEALLRARDASVHAFESAVLRSGWAVFLALHLGYCELGFLNALRARVFSESLSEPSLAQRAFRSEVDELVAVVFDGLRESPAAAVRGEFFVASAGRASHKMACRLDRMRGLTSEERPAATIFGERGFIDG